MSPFIHGSGYHTHVMKVVLKQTLTYQENEDRLQLVSQGEDDDILVLWLTRRLADRLVHALFQRMESSGDTAMDRDKQATLLAWAQQAAQADFEPSDPVPVTDTARQCLVQSIDIVPLEEDGQELVFRAPLYEARFAMSASLLRQWLGILHGWYRHAGWDTVNIWPAWFDSAEQTSEVLAPIGAVFH